jgi:hypothetical protein
VEVSSGSVTEARIAPSASHPQRPLEVRAVADEPVELVKHNPVDHVGQGSLEVGA